MASTSASPPDENEEEEDVARGSAHGPAFSFVSGMATYRLIDSAMKATCLKREIKMEFDPMLTKDSTCKETEHLKKYFSSGPATAVGVLTLALFFMADLTFHLGDNEGKSDLCKKNVKHGVWGILFVARAMGTVNGVSTHIDNLTEIAITGHWLNLASLVYDQVELSSLLERYLREKTKTIKKNKEGLEGKLQENKEGTAEKGK